jgi:UDP-GlcNAc:undecaprenyl-phosphate/decaprenyl-phosphate GlcNAc-1-phosphate transferase
MTLYFVYVFLLATALSAFLTVLVRDTAVSKGLKSAPVFGRHTHTKPLPRLGGLAICLAFMIVIGFFPISRLNHTSFSERHFLGILIPVLAIFLMGIYDDLRPMTPKWKLVVQAAAATFFYFSGLGVTALDHLMGDGLLARGVGLALTVGWILLITNAFNLIDGLDGLAAGSALISSIPIFVLALEYDNHLVMVFVVVLFGAILGFLPFNFNPASIFMGDSGSLFIGFLLSAMALTASQHAGGPAAVAIPILAFGLPILDVSLAISRRLLSRKPLFRGDTEHIHHKVLRRGFSHRQGVLALYAVTTVFCLASLAIEYDQRMLIPALFAIVVGIGFGVKRLQYTEFSNLLVGAFPKRQTTAQAPSVRLATQALVSCSDFRTICQILQESFQPEGFEGLRLKNLGKDGFPVALLHSLHCDSEGNFVLTWSEREPDETSWIDTFEVLSRPSEGIRLRSHSVFHSEPTEDLRLSFEILAEEFRSALSQAIRRASDRMHVLRGAERAAELNSLRAVFQSKD